MARRGTKKAAVGCGVALLVVLGIVALSPFGQGVRDLWSRGIVQGLVQKTPERHVAGASDENLKRLRTALLLYHKSEDRFPEAKGWNDAARKRLGADDLAKGEEARILTRPGAAVGGYALNAAVAGKYQGDLAPTTVLLYESKREIADAAGDPKTDALPRGRGITVGGALVSVP